MKRTEAIEWLEVMKEDAIFEQYDALKMAIEALKEQEISNELQEYAYECGYELFVHECQNCEYRRAEPTHGRLIDADALMEYCSNQKTKTISNNDIARFPKAQANRPHGEWIETTSGTICSNCGEYPYDDGEYHIANWHSNFCPSCGADMGQEK